MSGILIIKLAWKTNKLLLIIIIFWKNENKSIPRVSKTLTILAWGIGETPYYGLQWSRLASVLGDGNEMDAGPAPSSNRMASGDCWRRVDGERLNDGAKQLRTKFWGQSSVQQGSDQQRMVTSTWTSKMPARPSSFVHTPTVVGNGYSAR